MKSITLSNIGRAGLNTDIQPWELGPEFINDGLNFRVRDGAISPFSGSLPAVDPPPAALHSGWLVNMNTDQGEKWVVGAREGLWMVWNRVWSDISSGDYHLGEDQEYRWSGGLLGQILIANNAGFYPEYWNSNGLTETMTGLPFRPGETWQDLGLRCGVMRVHKNFLIAMDLQGSEDSPGGFHISHPADIDGFPYTWDTDDRSSIAIRSQVGSTSGRIIEGLTLRDNFIMYSEEAINVLTYNPNSEFYWSRREVSATKGLLSLNCVVEVKGLHYFITSDADIVAFDGSTIRSILHNRIAKRFKANINHDVIKSSFVSVNHKMKEVWFCVPELSSTTPNVAYVYNYVDDSWSIRDLPSTLVFASYGSTPLPVGDEPEADQIGIWDTVKSAWSNIQYAWGAEQRYITQNLLIGLDIDGSLSILDTGAAIREAAFNCVILRSDYALDGHPNNSTVTRLYIHAAGDRFRVEVGSQQWAGGEITWNDPVEFVPGETRKIDSRTTGELFCWRISSIGTNRFTVSGFDIEYVEAGRR